MNPDSFKFECPSCGQRLSATGDDIGASAECPACGKPLVVPSPISVLPPSPQSQSRSLPASEQGSPYKMTDPSVIVALSEPIVGTCNQVLRLCGVITSELDPMQNITMRGVVVGIIASYAVIGNYLEQRDVIQELTTIVFMELWNDSYDHARKMAEQALQHADLNTPMRDHSGFGSLVLAGGLFQKALLDGKSDMVRAHLNKLLKETKM